MTRPRDPFALDGSRADATRQIWAIAILIWSAYAAVAGVVLFLLSRWL